MGPRGWNLKGQNVSATVLKTQTLLEHILILRSSVKPFDAIARTLTTTLRFAMGKHGFVGLKVQGF